jgi:UDP-N-acetylmuramyl pentapeptide phosphotransferase/UDP-N-acetylglucosamine-1-phosphate transferase
MKPPAPPQLDPKIEDEIVRGILAREAESKKLESSREESRKRTLIGGILLLAILFSALLFWQWQEARLTCGFVVVCWLVLLVIYEGWRHHREKRRAGR